MKIRFCFYKARIDGKFLDNAIAAWTGLFPCNWGTPPYSHVEVWFPNLGDKGTEWGGGIVWSSSTRGARWPGVRCGLPDMILNHPERWDMLEFDGLDKKELRKAEFWCHAQSHKPYDFAGIFGFMWPWNTQNKNKWYCSEFCAKVARLLGLTKVLHKRISPRRLSKVLGNVGNNPNYGRTGGTWLHWDKDSKTWK